MAVEISTVLIDIRGRIFYSDGVVEVILLSARIINMNPIKRMRLQLAEKMWDKDGNFSDAVMPFVVVALVLLVIVVGTLDVHTLILL
jgi:hypothetical protein